MLTGRMWTWITLLVGLLFLIVGCGGGSGGGGNKDADTQLTGIQGSFDQQSDTAVDFFNSFGTLLRSMKDLEDEIADTSSTEEDAQAEIIRKLRDRIIPMTVEVTSLSEKMKDLEEDIQGLTPFHQQDTLEISSDTLTPRGVITTTIIAGVCAVGTLTSFHISLEDALAEYRNDTDICIDVVDQTEENRPADQTGAEWAEYTRVKWDHFDACIDLANDKYNAAGIWASIGTGLGLVGSNIPQTTAGRFTVGFASSYLDAAQIYLWGTRPADSVEIKQAGPITTQAGSDVNSDLEMFITTVDNDGDFTAPVGTWHIAAFRKGYARLGTPQGDPVNLIEGDTTEIMINPIPVDEVTEDDLVCSADPGDDNTPPDTNDDPDGTGSMSGSFSATCSDGSSDGSDFTVTISETGSVTGTYDYGNISGGVYDGFMSVTMDGDWSDCVMGGDLSGSGSSLSGSGTVSCSGGACYGTWRASN